MRRYIRWICKLNVNCVDTCLNELQSYSIEGENVDLRKHGADNLYT